jgi:hypothetical protein
LKENVILGKLIPAGTGHAANAHLLPQPEPRKEEFAALVAPVGEMGITSDGFGLGDGLTALPDAPADPLPPSSEE